ncbi:MAG TPA: mannose-6-phosphate isomerase, class I [Propionibacteriaceae bacterium]|nr:mannose-6-phosphate isomerase, class I [Propionibacteriaceae bacterium]
MISRMQGTIQRYAWGTTDFIAELLGREPSGEPQAELWLGAHPSTPSLVGDRPLTDLIAEDADAVVGSESVAAFGPTLPYLLKVLSAAAPLSLQAHPSRAQAKEGFAAEEAAGIARDAAERTYRDDWPKPEMLCALVETEILCGFRSPAETYALFEQLGLGSTRHLIEPLREGGAAELEQVFGDILRLGEDASSVIGEVAQAAQRADSDFARTARELAERYPKDPGVLAALLMNRLTLAPADAVYLPAGNLHAYLRGSGIEIMANSDNVLRGGLTSKHVDVEELRKVLDFTPGVPGLVSCVEEQPGLWTYETPAPEFALWRLELTGSPLRLPATASGRVLLVVDGSVSAHDEEQPALTLQRGQSAFVSAGEQVALEGTGTVFVAGPGVASS